MAVRCRAGAVTNAGVCDGPGSAKQREERCIAPGTRQNEKRRAEARRFRFSWFASDHCSRRSTLCCDWLASASAETAIDWRVDSAWLLAASSLESARVRLADPVCSTLMMFFAKS